MTRVVVSPESPGDDYRNQGMRLFDAWVIAHRPITPALQTVADELHMDRSQVHRWRKERIAPEHHRAGIETVTGVPAVAWQTWELTEEADGTTAPASANGGGQPKPRERAAAVPLAPPREVGGVEDELRRLLQLLNRYLEGSAGLSPAQVTALARSATAALKTLTALEARRSISEHPDFEEFVDDVFDAVKDALGPDAPDGIGVRILEHLEQRRSARAERRAAA